MVPFGSSVLDGFIILFFGAALLTWIAWYYGWLGRLLGK